MSSPISIPKQKPVPHHPSVWLWRVAIFTALWWVVSDGEAGSWIVGIPVIATAAWLSARLLPGAHWSVLGLLRFLPVFLWLSLKGAVDISARALSPGLQLRPTLVEYELQLDAAAGRLFFAFVVSLLPGTLSADLKGRCLLIHALDERLASRDQLRALERRIGLTLREKLPEEMPA